MGVSTLASKKLLDVAISILAIRGARSTDLDIIKLQEYWSNCPDIDESNDESVQQDKYDKSLLYTLYKELKYSRVRGDFNLINRLWYYK